MSPKNLAVVAVFLLSLIAAVPARAGLIINVAYGAGVPAVAETDFNNLVATYESAFANNITVNLDVNWGATVLGASSTAGYFIGNSMVPGYPFWRSALASDSAANPGNAYLASGVASLPGNDPIGDGIVVITSANAKALGLVNPNGGATDSTLLFSNTANFEYNGVATPGAYDFTDVAAHELNEALGIGSTLTGIPNNGPLTQCGEMGSTGTCFQAEDFFRYGSPATRAITTNPNAVVYFSYNGGSTDVAQFNQDNNAAGNAAVDRNDWIYADNGCPPAAPGPYVQDAVSCANQAIGPGVGSPEFIVLDTLGYDPTPEPSSILLVTGGLVLLAVLRRNIRKAI